MICKLVSGDQVDMVNSRYDGVNKSINERIDTLEDALNKVDTEVNFFGKFFVEFPGFFHYFYRGKRLVHRPQKLNIRVTFIGQLKANSSKKLSGQKNNTSTKSFFQLKLVVKMSLW